jgi:hypothetical protein
MKRTAHEIVVGGELPRIGSGYRLVYAYEGRKWVHLTTLHGDGKTRLSKKAWGQIKKLRMLDDKDIQRGLRKAKRKLYTP